MEQTDLFKRESQRGLLWWIPVVAVALIVARVVSLQLGSAAKSEGSDPTLVNWVSFAEAQKLAARTNKPIMFDFSAEWCGPCKQLDRRVFADGAFAARINQRFIAVKVMDRRREDGSNSREVDALQRRFSVQAFPTVVFADANLNEIARKEGFGGPAAFAKLIDSVPR